MAKRTRAGGGTRGGGWRTSGGPRSRLPGPPGPSQPPTSLATIPPAVPGAPSAPQLTRQPAPANLTEAQLESVEALAGAAVAKNTARAYDVAWRSWSSWCRSTGNSPLPGHPAALAAYIGWLGELGRSTSTMGQHLGAIGWMHRHARLPSPTDDPGVQVVAKGYRRTYGRPAKKRAAIDLELLRRLVAEIRGRGSVAVRNRSLLTLGWFSALRKENLAELRVDDIQPAPGGLQILLRRSKTDQEGHGVTIGVAEKPGDAICPVTALKAWMQVRTAELRTWLDSSVAPHADSGWLFFRFGRDGVPHPEEHLTGEVTYDLIKELLTRVGVDPKRYGVHSLRAGFVTQAQREGIGLGPIAAVTKHKDPATLLGYFRADDPIAGSAAHVGEGRGPLATASAPVPTAPTPTAPAPATPSMTTTTRPPAMRDIFPADFAGDGDNGSEDDGTSLPAPEVIQLAHLKPDETAGLPEPRRLYGLGAAWLLERGHELALVGSGAWLHVTNLSGIVIVMAGGHARIEAVSDKLMDYEAVLVIPPVAARSKPVGYLFRRARP